MHKPFRILCAVVMSSVVMASYPAHGGETGVEGLLPAPGFEPGWVKEGKTAVYDRENLYTYINGEAELFLPYGFESLGSALYVNANDRRSGIRADVYRMGSLLDAFGIYSSFRGTEAERIAVGVEGSVDQAQLMFYKDRYFVQLNASGESMPERRVFVECAETIAKRLPGTLHGPRELELLKIPGIRPGTERYHVQSVLGYSFFKRGLTAEAGIGASPVKVIVVFLDSGRGVEEAVDRYIKYLEEAGIRARITKEDDAITLKAADPLYKGVMLRTSGSYLYGVTNLDNPDRGMALVNVLQARIAGPQGN